MQLRSEPRGFHREDADRAEGNRRNRVLAATPLPDRIRRPETRRVADERLPGAEADADRVTQDVEGARAE